MPKFDFKKDDITDEQFLNIHNLQAENILTAEEEELVSQLFELMKRARDAFTAILADYDRFNPDAIANTGDE